MQIKILFSLIILFFVSCSKSDESVQATIPLAPSNLQYTITPIDRTTSPDTPAKIHLTWTDNSDNENEFRIQHKSEGSSSWTGDGVDVTPNSYYSRDIITYSYSNGVRYYGEDSYRVYARNSAGDSSYSNVITVSN